MQPPSLIRRLFGWTNQSTLEEGLSTLGSSSAAYKPHTHGVAATQPPSPSDVEWLCSESGGPGRGG